MKLGYTIIYVADVPNTVAFYEAAFGLKQRFIHEFVTDDVQVAYDRAVSHGCQPVGAPSEKPWGQTVSYVRDLDGCIVEIASPVGTSV